MSTPSLDALPCIIPPGGSPVTSDAPAIQQQPVAIDHVPDVDPIAPDKVVLSFLIAEGVAILAARVHLAGTEPANPVNLQEIGDVVEVDNNVEIDFGAQRPFTKIDFTNTGTSRLMIQLGGTWIQPEDTLTARFANYRSGTPFSELIAQRVLLTNATGVTNIESKSHPANVTLRLTDGGVPFFFHQGELRNDGVGVPDFGQQLALALQTSEPENGQYKVDLVAHSDAFGVITASQPQITYRVVHNSLAGQTFAERTVEILGDETVVLQPGMTLPPGQVAVSAVALGLIASRFGPAIVGPKGSRGAVVSAQFQVAQAVQVEQMFTVSAVYLYLMRRTTQAALTVELRQDADGEPRGAVVTRLSLSADRLAADNVEWFPVILGAPVSIAADRRLWIVLKADQGEVEWRGDQEIMDQLDALFSSDRGNTWQRHPMSASFIFQQLLPDPVSPLTIQMQIDDFQQDILYDPGTFPLVLDASSPLVQGINQIIQTSNQPETISLRLSTDSPLPVRVTLTQADLTLTQTHEPDL